MNLFKKYKIKGVPLFHCEKLEEQIYPSEEFFMEEQKDILGRSHEHFKTFSSIIRPYFVYGIKNGICRTNKEEIFIAPDKVINELTSQYLNPEIGRKKLDAKKIKNIKGSVATLSLSGLEDNYYHWMMECLGRLYLIKKSKFEPDYYIVSQNLEFKKEYMKILGIDENKIIAAENNEIIKADELVVADFINNWKYIDFRGYKHYQKQYLPSWIGNLYKDMVINPCESKRTKIYVSREYSSYRKILNEEEFVKLLEKYGFKTIYPEKMSIKEQISEFSNAEYIVSPMGAGLANIVYCNRDTKILEICPQYFHTSCLRILAHCKKIKYDYFVGDTENISMHPQQENICVNINMMTKALSMFLSGVANEL